MSQGDIEKRTDLIRCYVSRVENGHTVPSLETLEKFAKAMGISLAQLFTSNGEEPQPIAALKVKFKGEGALTRSKEHAILRIRQAVARMKDRDVKILLAIAQKYAARTDGQ
ncbi:MAG TPA: helix-turn-helix transcriptional regulator [Terriglobia bacterium]|nr:helix-turn-helix transcriptional regulator [Terriglobia bacterium]